VTSQPPSQITALFARSPTGLFTRFDSTIGQRG